MRPQGDLPPNSRHRMTWLKDPSMTLLCVGEKDRLDNLISSHHQQWRVTSEQRELSGVCRCIYATHSRRSSCHHPPGFRVSSTKREWLVFRKVLIASSVLDRHLQSAISNFLATTRESAVFLKSPAKGRHFSKNGVPLVDTALLCRCQTMPHPSHTHVPPLSHTCHTHVTQHARFVELPLCE
jgi:hypothetical protein